MTATNPLPAHVQKHLVATGVLTTDGLGRRAQLRQCGVCSEYVIVGLDHHRAALRAVCDPVALDALGEAVAWCSGRRTFELWGTELEARNQFSISGGIKPRVPVISEHECGVSKTATPEIMARFLRPKSKESKGEAPY
jgi:hypothetical protein